MMRARRQHRLGRAASPGSVSRPLAIASVFAAVVAACASGSASDEESTADRSVPADTAAGMPQGATTTTSTSPVADADATMTSSGPVVESSTTPTSAAVTTPTVPEFVAQTRPRDCVGEAPPEATCSWVELPADWSTPDGDTVVLPVTVLAASNPAPQPDPIVIPAGGPGFDVATAYGWTNAPFNGDRDLVPYDQRGTGLSEPLLDCPEVDDAQVANLQRAAAYEVELQAITDAYRACRQRLADDGIDFDDYDTEASVRDLDAIRHALDYPAWNIYGGSYGARLALAAMRSTPDSIRAVVLDSVYDVTNGGIANSIANAERGYQALAAACAADPDCAAAHDVAAAIDDIYQQWEADPIEVEENLGDGTGPQTFVITGSDALAGLFNALYDSNLVPVLPAVLSGFAAGDTTFAAELVRSGIPALTDSANAMAVSVNCADNTGLDLDQDRAVRVDPGRQALLAIGPLCDEWPVEPTSPTFNQPVRSDIPALVFAGAFDPVTAHAETEAAARHLTNATYVLFPDAGHGVVRPDATCAEAMVIAFLDTPDSDVDTTCVATIPPVDFT